jgi:hypothetical protein
MRVVAGVLSVALFCCGLFVFAQAQQGQPVGPYPPCTAFGTAAGTCPNGGVITAGGPTGAATTVPVITYNAAGQLTAVTTAATGVTTVGTAAVGQIPGTATNDAAGAGKVGEYVVSGAANRNSLNATATVTISIANPAVISWTTNPYFNAAATGNGCASLVVFSTTGALPTGLTATAVPYYVTCDAGFTANAFHVSTSVANAEAGTTVTTSGTQSGVQTAINAFILTSGSSIDFGGLALSAGDWDVAGILMFIPSGTTSVTVTSGAITSATAFSGTLYSSYVQRQAAEVPGNIEVFPLSTERISVPSTTTFFCGISSTFSLGTLFVGGECRARRVR